LLRYLWTTEGKTIKPKLFPDSSLHTGITYLQERYYISTAHSLLLPKVTFLNCTPEAQRLPCSNPSDPSLSGEQGGGRLTGLSRRLGLFQLREAVSQNKAKKSSCIYLGWRSNSKFAQNLPTPLPQYYSEGTLWTPKVLNTKTRAKALKTLKQ